MKTVTTMFLGMLLLQGCGFQLRGATPEAKNIPLTYVQAANASLLQAQLSRIDKVTENAEAAQVVLNIINESFDRRVLSVGSSSGKVREYELRYQVNFQVADKTGKELLPAQTINLTRDYLFNEMQVLGSDSEEVILRRDMVRDAAGQIMRRLQALNKNNT
ncbi:MAG: LPS assembly lipoprotein LptE [Gammaproteobacteria bacterium]